MGSFLLIYLAVNLIGIPTVVNACSKMGPDVEPPYVDLPTVAPMKGDVDW